MPLGLYELTLFCHLLNMHFKSSALWHIYGLPFIVPVLKFQCLPCPVSKVLDSISGAIKVIMPRSVPLFKTMSFR